MCEKGHSIFNSVFVHQNTVGPQEEEEDEEEDNEELLNDLLRDGL